MAAGGLGSIDYPPVPCGKPCYPRRPRISFHPEAACLLKLRHVSWLRPIRESQRRRAALASRNIYSPGTPLIGQSRAERGMAFSAPLLILCRKIPAACFSCCRKQPLAKNPSPENIPGFSPWRSGKPYHQDQATAFLPEKPALAKLNSFGSSQERWHGFLRLGSRDACKAYSRAC